jgi:hypothetical protein
LLKIFAQNRKVIEKYSFIFDQLKNIAQNLTTTQKPLKDKNNNQTYRNQSLINTQYTKVIISNLKE